MKFDPLIPHTDINPKNVYFDADMTELRSGFKSLKDVFDRIEKRWERHLTTQIARSVFDFYSTQKLALTYPQLIYDFRSDEVRICIVRRGSEYFCSIVGWKPPVHRFRDYVHDKGYGPYPDVPSARRAYIDLVRVYCSEVSELLPW